VEFAPVIVDPKASRPEVVVGSITIRLDEGASAALHCRCCTCLRGSGMIFPSTRVRIMVATKSVDFRKVRLPR